MVSPEAGRQVAPERHRKGIITRTIASGLTIGALLLVGCETPRNKGLAPVPTSYVTPIEQDLTGVKLHCIVIPKGETPILDHKDFACDAKGNPIFTGFTPSATPSESTPVANSNNQDGS